MGDREKRRLLLALCFLVLALVCPPFSYLMAPRFLGFPSPVRITRVEYDHEYFGAI